MKPRVAFFDFTGCEGCQLEVLNFVDEVLDLLNAVEIVNFREIMSEKGEDYDIAFIEGSVSRESEIPRLLKIRDQAKIVVALGACATIGGVNCLKNRYNMTDALRMVYKGDARYYDTAAARPIHAVVKVDYKVYQCPANKEEFLKVTKAMLLGKRPDIPNYAVCTDCKVAENQCVFEKGMYCVGPITRAGCKAICVTNGRICWGCRGLMDDPNIYAEAEVLHKYGLTVNQSLERFRIYNAYSGVFR
jgi:coenzyme F420-reducing hydrogenase gamma subunit